ncbi:hypothetical protein ES705_17186 [subsurface metagenome]
MMQKNHKNLDDVIQMTDQIHNYIHYNKIPSYLVSLTERRPSGKHRHYKFTKEIKMVEISEEEAVGIEEEIKSVNSKI